MSRVVAAVRAAVAKVLALVTFERAAKTHACSKVVCIKSAKKSKAAKKGAKARKVAKKSRK